MCVDGRCDCRVKEELPVILEKMGETPLEDPKMRDARHDLSVPSSEDVFADNASRWHPKAKDSTGLVLLASVVTSSIRFVFPKRLLFFRYKT